MGSFSARRPESILGANQSHHSACAQRRSSSSRPASPQTNRRPTVAVLAVQGAFVEHERQLRDLGCDVVELRQRADLDRPFDGLVLPGGESTAQGKLLAELDMLRPLRERILGGLPVLGTCAGLILLAQSIEGAGDTQQLDETLVADRTQVQGLRTLPCTVVRNGYGRQLGSFTAYAPFGPVGAKPAGESANAAAVTAPNQPASTAAPAAAATRTIPMVFIRAPYIAQVGEGCQVLACVDGRIAAVRHENQIACTFHPELTDDTTVYQAFLSLL